jgi:hypothetical protein
MNVPFSIAILLLASVGTSAPAPTNAFPGLRFAPVAIRVNDGTTGRPVVGALVSPLCLGGTPYGTNTYRTDTNGIARAMFVDGWTAAVNVKMDGYEPASFAFLQSTNRVVILKRVTQ